MFKYEFEDELQEYIIKNFNQYFPFMFVANEVSVSSFNKRIDLLGEDENNVYIIELKRDVINNKAIKQLKKYLSLYKTNKNKIGIAAALRILNDVQINENIFTLKLDNVKYLKRPLKRIKLNIDKDLLHKVKIKAIQENKNVNEILEEQIQNYLEEELKWKKYQKKNGRKY